MVLSLLLKVKMTLFYHFQFVLHLLRSMQMMLINNFANEIVFAISVKENERQTNNIRRRSGTLKINLCNILF